MAAKYLLPAAYLTELASTVTEKEQAHDLRTLLLGFADVNKTLGNWVVWANMSMKPECESENSSDSEFEPCTCYRVPKRCDNHVWSDEIMFKWIGCGYNFYKLNHLDVRDVIYNNMLIVAEELQDLRGVETGKEKGDKILTIPFNVPSAKRQNLQWMELEHVAEETSFVTALYNSLRMLSQDIRAVMQKNNGLVKQEEPPKKRQRRNARAAS